MSALREIGILTRREFLSAFRESSVVLYSILLPLLLYPFLLWLMVTSVTFVEGQQERHIYRVAYHESLERGAARPLLQQLRKAERVDLEAREARPTFPSLEYDLWMEQDPERPHGLLLEYVGDRAESVQAAQRVEEAVGQANQRDRRQWFREQQLDAELAVPFVIRGESTADSSDLGGYLLGALVPIGLLIMIALGGAYPAIDTMAGERERGTWETLQSCGPSLGRIVLSKYLFVSLVCCLSGLLNMVAMLISIRSIIAPMLRQNDQVTFEIGPATVLVLIAGVVAVSFFVAAALLLCSVFARTFREGQALTTPMFMAIALPVLPLSDPNVQLSGTMVLIPLVNLALVWRQALQGVFVPAHLVITGGTLAMLVGLCLWLGARLLRSETLMSGAGVEFSWTAVWRLLRRPSR